MSRRPLVSAVICVHNHARYVAEAVASVFAQGYPAVEAVVVDDASTDGTARVLRGLRFGRLKVLRLPRNGGPAQARNAGIGRAAGDFIAFLDADDRWTPDKLERQMAAFRPGVEFCHAETSLIDRRGGLRAGSYLGSQENDWRGFFPHFKAPPCTSSVVLRRRLLRKLGGFDAHYRYVYDDVDLWWRAGRGLAAGGSAFVRRPLVLKRMLGEGLMAQLTRAARKFTAGRRLAPRERELMLDRYYLVSKLGIDGPEFLANDRHPFHARALPSFRPVRSR